MVLNYKKLDVFSYCLYHGNIKIPWNQPTSLIPSLVFYSTKLEIIHYNRSRVMPKGTSGAKNDQNCIDKTI